jgi:hypothetical protein
VPFEFIFEHETIFVVEFIRHGARSHYEDNVPASFFDNVKKGYVTPKGKADQIHIGAKRRKEYINEKRFLTSENYNHNEILSIATFKQRCITSGEYFLHGMYPM